MFSHPIRLPRAILALCVLVAAACSPISDKRGTVPDKDNLSELRPGVHRREDVAALLGSPSTVATFDPNIWYYVGQTIETRGFLAPENKEQQVLRIAFDDQGVLQRVEKFDERHAQATSMNARTTPTSGQSLTLFQQLLGNVGRFGDAAQKK